MTALSRRSVAIGLGLGLLAGVAALGAGFAWFMHLADRRGEAPGHVDGIVAFTGGPERVETALRLLADGRADRLLLSGVGGGAELSDFTRRAGVDPLPMASRVTLDRNAATTRENAADTAEWARSNGVRSLLVVTASYHMPRAITELERALPEVVLYPMPVVQAMRPEGTAAPLRLMAEEYIKFLATTTGLSAVFPEREPTLTHGSRAG